jgi:polyphosphate kinase
MSNPAPGRFINRELSWLEFNQRVLDEALDPRTPLLERVKFFCIASNNLDEFFEVRVAGLKQQKESGVNEPNLDALTPAETLTAVARKVRGMVERQYACWRQDLVPGLARSGIRFLQTKDLAIQDRAWLDQYYASQVHPVLTPLGLDPAHPFPQLLNKSLNLMVRLEIEKDGGQPTQRLAVVQVPRNLPRLVRLPGPESRFDYVFLGQLIGSRLEDLFPGGRIVGFWAFRVTRNSELYIDEETAANLLKEVEEQVHNRRKGQAVRLEVQLNCPQDIRAQLLQTLDLEEDDLYVIDGPLNPGGLMQICDGRHAPELRDPAFLGATASAFRDQPDAFQVIRTRDVLLHHPYETFESVIGFLEQAARDPKVLAIKQTLYRTGGDRRVVGALMEAVRQGKQVTAVVELKARFDEVNNIHWARQLDEAGVHVLYGLVGLKIHAKICLIVRAEDDGLRRYVHLSTGNYNPTTARIYTDVGLLTCRPEFGEDATNLMNLLTGICQFQGLKRLIAAPFELHDRIKTLVQREAENARRGLPARILAKMNALADPEIIEALYQASQAGVTIDLIVRGLCCLRPGIPGLSERITVRSIVDRFLEHSRVFYFENACQPEVYLGSADWMPRNFFRRIEVLFPIEDGVLRERIIHEILSVSFADNQKARFLLPDGSYQRHAPRRHETARRSQNEFIALAQAPVEPSGKQRRTTAPRHPKLKLRPRPNLPPNS